VPHTLLLADDSVTIQRVIELTFADEDVNVVAVSDGDQAIQRIESAPPDIVLADIGMPGKNGYEVAQHIRQSPRLAHIPVVLLTGAFEPVDQARAAEAGCDGVLAKPFEPQLVIGRVKELLAKSHGKSDAAAAAPAAPRAEPARGGWPPPAPEPPKPAAAESQEAAAFDLHDYFDRLDAAFSSGAPAAQPPAAAPAPAPSDLDWFSAQASSEPAGEPWDFAPPQETQATYASPPPAQAFPAFEPHEAMPPAPAAEEPVPFSFAGDVPPIAPPAPADVPPPHAMADTDTTLASMPPSTAGMPVVPQAAPLQAPASGASASLPPLADAFAALLVAEENEPAADASMLWQAGAAPAAPIDDAVIEAAVRRVLERLTDQVVRETVGDIVSRVAEQLVRQEIERIKAQLR